MKPKTPSKLMWDLDNGTIEERCRTLTILCPCRNRVYDREIWQVNYPILTDKDGASWFSGKSNPFPPQA